jgi:hopanoid biosynthesis associated protein HpnK
VTSAARRLIVSGDDFGVAEEVNEGILRSHRDGILGQTSLMVTGAAAAHAVALAKAMPSLAVGLHLVLAQGRPAAEPSTIPELVRADGAFRDTPIRNGLRYAWAYVRAVGRAQLVREIDAQLAAFAATGLELAHVDGHLNMHLHPMVLPILLELAPRYGIRATRVSRESLQAALRWDPRHAARKCFEGVAFHTLAAYASPRLRAAGIVSSDRVFGMHQTGHVDESYLLHVIATLPPGVSEIYGHPATRQAAVMAGFQDGYDHAGEVAGFTSPRVRAALASAGVALTTYRDLVQRT